MAHNLNIVRGEAAFAFIGAKPWHGLGLAVPSRMNIRQALIAGKLDWSVHLMPLKTTSEMFLDNDGSGSMIPEIDVKTHKATVRGDTKAVLGIVGSDYQPVQNLEAFSFFEEALGKGAAVVETVGALGKGEVVFCMAKLPEVTEVVKGDFVEQYLLLSTSHDGTQAIRVCFSSTRVVCQNTMNMALRRARNIVSIKHTKNAKESLSEAHKVLEANEKYWEKCREALQFMASKEMNTGEVRDFLKALFPAKTLLNEATGEEEEQDASQRQENIRSDVELLFNGQATGSNLAGKTRWGMYNAVTHHVDWQRNLRTRKDGTKPDRWAASVFGLGAGIRQRAADLLLV
jgi:phage/plasmid-like protein (TIGR03299 family)